MWVPPLKEQLGPDLWHAWDTLKQQAFDLLGTDQDSEDPWLFHGTNAIRAGNILKDGFTPATLFSANRTFPTTYGVYWGHPAIAASFAERFAAADNPPVIFAARASVVAMSTPDGVLRPDNFACEASGCPRSYPDGLDHESAAVPAYRMDAVAELAGLPPTEDGGRIVRTWQQSLCLSGAITAPDGRHVPELVLFAARDDVTLTSDATKLRGNRLRPLSGMPDRLAKLDLIAPGMELSIDPRMAVGARAVIDPACIGFDQAGMEFRR